MHLRRIPNQFKMSFNLNAKIEIFFLELPLVESIPDQNRHFLKIKGLFQVIIGTQFGRLDGCFKRSMTRHHDDQ